MNDDLRSAVADLMPRAKRDLAELVAFQSVADESVAPREECERAAQWVAEAFADVGMTDVGLHEATDGSKTVFGQASGPEGAPTVILYSHYDVQPALDEDSWQTPPWELTERDDGRWYGRGTADCKGNLIAHLIALRALGPELPVNVKLVAEGSEEQGSGGLDQFVPQNAELLRADAILIGDGGNFEVGMPTITTSLRGVANVIVTVKALSGALHSGIYGGAAPDPFAALVQILASLRDEHGNTTIDGVDNTQTWGGVDYPAERFRRDAGILDGVDVAGSGSVAEMLWERPVLTVLGIDFPQVSGSVAAIQPQVRARLNLRLPPDADVDASRAALIEHIRAHAPWNVQLEFEPDVAGAGFVGSTGGPALDALSTSMNEAYGQTVQTMGVGGAIPLCSVLKDAYPDAEILILGVEEPSCLIH